MKKWYRIFELVNGQPEMTTELAWKDNYFKTEAEAEKKLPKYVKKTYGENILGMETFLILPVYSKKKTDGIK